jgi:hypothetical protein
MSRIASQELQVKNCKSRIASQELQKKSFSRSLMSERIFSLVLLPEEFLNALLRLTIL